MGQNRDYTLLEQLGRGAQGVVHKAKRVADGSHVAVKQVFLSTMSKKDQAEAAHEVRVLSKLSHPNVIRYLDSFNQGSTLFIVTELAEGGNLTDALKRTRQRGTLLSEKLVWKYFLQTAVGLQHIHSRKILHRDIKTMNIFLTKDDNIKVGDLGVARILNNTNELANTMVGTPYYLSPELCEGRPYNDKSDVWSLGCVLYELCTLKHPFDASNQVLAVEVSYYNCLPHSSHLSRPPSCNIFAPRHYLGLHFEPLFTYDTRGLLSSKSFVASTLPFRHHTLASSPTC